LKNALDISVKTINWIMGRTLNHRLFNSHCEDLGSEHKVLLFNTEVRWLSCGRCFNRFFELREQLKVLSGEKRQLDLPEEFG